jgi:septal ring factor EnvC (AmiA/AmiB activator)
MAAEVEQLKAALASATAETEQLKTQAADVTTDVASIAAERDSLAVQRDALVAERDNAVAQRSELQAAYDKLAQESAAGTQSNSVELTTLRADRDALLGRVADAESKAAKAAESAPNSQQAADMQRRFELAVEDVRDLKRRNSLLEEELATLKASGGSKGADGAGTDWESCKRRLMASLEAEDAPRGNERLTIEGTIRITDEVIAEKDREVKQLSRRLREADPENDTAVSADTRHALASNDEIRAEREKLDQLQHEWQEKLRQAEIDISIERAKIARERAQIEERLNKIEEEEAIRAANAPIVPGQPPRQPNRGRWLERLGLKDKDGDEKKS